MGGLSKPGHMRKRREPRREGGREGVREGGRGLPCEVKVAAWWVRTCMSSFSSRALWTRRKRRGSERAS